MTVRTWFGLTALLFTGIAVFAFGLFDAVLFGVPLPLFDEIAGYGIASLGALALGLAWMCGLVVRTPRLVDVVGVPVGISILGLAFVRYGALFYGHDLVAAGLAPALLAEIAFFGVFGGMLAGLKSDEVQPWVHWKALFDAVRQLRPLLKGWLVVLCSVLFVAPLAFLDQRPVQMLLVAQFLNFGVGHALLVHTGGLTRGTSAAHLITWPPAAIAMALALFDGSGSGAWLAWLAAGTGVITLCLALDLADTVRWIAGEREPLAYSGVAQDG